MFRPAGLSDEECDSDGFGGGTNINDDFQQHPPHSSIFSPGSDGDGGKTEADNNIEYGVPSSEAAAAAVAADDLAHAIEAGDLASVTTLVEDGVSVTAPLEVGLWTDQCAYYSFTIPGVGLGPAEPGGAGVFARTGGGAGAPRVPGRTRAR